MLAIPRADRQACRSARGSETPIQWWKGSNTKEESHDQAPRQEEHEGKGCKEIEGRRQEKDAPKKCILFIPANPIQFRGNVRQQVLSGALFSDFGGQSLMLPSQELSVLSKSF